MAKGLGGTFSYFELAGLPVDELNLLKGKGLPSFKQLAAYIYHTATGLHFDEKASKSENGLIGSTSSHDVYLIYADKLETLKTLALTSDTLKTFKKGDKRRLVFAPTHYLTQEMLDDAHVDFCHLPWDLGRRVM